jgi:hypothetical protein
VDEGLRHARGPLVPDGADPARRPDPGRIRLGRQSGRDLRRCSRYLDGRHRSNALLPGVVPEPAPAARRSDLLLPVRLGDGRHCRYPIGDPRADRPHGRLVDGVGSAAVFTTVKKAWRSCRSTPP